MLLQVHWEVFRLQLNPRNKISVKSILNVNTQNSVIKREGYDIPRNDAGERH